jgi:uncharacterized protein (UPF0261 family)
MLGNTTKAVMALKDRLAKHGYEAVIFHSNGVGGPAMEELAETGHFIGVIDFTTNETFDPMTGGIHDGGPDRLKRVGLLGLPQVVVPGCIDFCVFHAGAIPPALQGRPVYDHNPEYTLVRATQAEMVALGDLSVSPSRPRASPSLMYRVVPSGTLKLMQPSWNPCAVGSGKIFPFLPTNAMSTIPNLASRSLICSLI